LLIALFGRYREFFAQDRENSLLSDPNLLLIAAHENEDIFKIERLSPEEVSLAFVEATF